MDRVLYSVHILHFFKIFYISLKIVLYHYFFPLISKYFFFSTIFSYFFWRSLFPSPPPPPKKKNYGNNSDGELIYHNIFTCTAWVRSTRTFTRKAAFLFITLSIMTMFVLPSRSFCREEVDCPTGGGWGSPDRSQSDPSPHTVHSKQPMWTCSTV